MALSNAKSFSGMQVASAGGLSRWAWERAHWWLGARLLECSPCYRARNWPVGRVRSALLYNRAWVAL